ncbi:MAG TPA: hypothetical protein V6D14_14400 [Coleofasciculaceae cyanobacterium]|jgi:hypothetical protein
MRIRKNLKKLTSALVSSLQQAGYEISQATGGWHIHKGNIYCGNLQYQDSKGWQGSALHHLPSELLEQLKKITTNSTKI